MRTRPDRQADPSASRRKQAVFYNALDMAAAGRRRILTPEPAGHDCVEAARGRGESRSARVANPNQVHELLTALTYVGARDQDRGGGLVAMFAAIAFGYQGSHLRGHRPRHPAYIRD
jgi:hypothetical protein